jgi:hypothetical protein
MQLEAFDTAATYVNNIDSLIYRFASLSRAIYFAPSGLCPFVRETQNSYIFSSTLSRGSVPILVVSTGMANADRIAHCKLDTTKIVFGLIRWRKKMWLKPTVTVLLPGGSIK